MSAQTIDEAKAFILQADLPAARPDFLGSEATAPGAPFDAVTQQAAVVGSEVISFVEQITPEQRQDLVNAALLAQLVADKKVPSTKDLDGVKAWYREYFNVLSHVGFAVQESGFAEYTEGGETFEAHEAIIEVVKVALAGAPAAIPIVIKTLESLKNLDKDSPWLTIFHRQSRSANTGRFQVSLANSDTSGSSLSVIAFGITAKATVTQVLFFRFKKNESTLHHESAKLSINDLVLTAVRDDITQKITRFSKDFVAGLEI